MTYREEPHYVVTESCHAENNDIRRKGATCFCKMMASWPQSRALEKHLPSPLPPKQTASRILSGGWMAAPPMCNKYQHYTNINYILHVFFCIKSISRALKEPKNPQHPLHPVINSCQYTTPKQATTITKKTQRTTTLYKACQGRSNAIKIRRSPIKHQTILLRLN